MASGRADALIHFCGSVGYENSFFGGGGEFTHTASYNGIIKPVLTAYHMYH